LRYPQNTVKFQGRMDFGSVISMEMSERISLRNKHEKSEDIESSFRAMNKQI